MSNLYKGKLTQEHYAVLQAAMRILFDNHKDAINSHIVELKQDSRVKDIKVRFAWDNYWAANKLELLPTNWQNEVYKYCNDTHIQTALFHIQYIECGAVL